MENTKHNFRSMPAIVGYVILAALLALSACSGGDEEKSSLMQWFSTPLAEITIGEFIIVAMLIRFITRKK